MSVDYCTDMRIQHSTVEISYKFIINNSIHFVYRGKRDKMLLVYSFMKINNKLLLLNKQRE